MTAGRLDHRHQALASATLAHDGARDALRAAGFSVAKRRSTAKTWLGAYREAAEAEEFGAELVPVAEELLIALAGADETYPDAFADALYLRRAVTSALLFLTPREERIVRLRFFGELTCIQIADSLSLRPERIRQIEAMALRKLMHPRNLRRLREHMGTDCRPPKRARNMWTPRGDASQHALDQTAPTWARFRLLSARAPNAPNGLASALAKLHGTWSKNDVERMTCLLVDGGAGAKALYHAREITPALTLTLSALPAPLREGRIAALLNPQQADLVTRAAARIGANSDAGVMDRLRERLSRAQSTQHLFRMLVAEIGVRPRTRAPQLAAPWLKPLTNVQEMQRAALAYRNCLRDHIPSMLAGNAAYFEVLEPSPAILQVARAACGPWFFGQIKGRANTRVDPDLNARVLSVVR